MDLTQHNFAYYLPWLLKELTQSYFVSIDFELSGISLAPSSQIPKIQTLQERYLENKVAAEKYQIIQIGLTICNEDAANGTYNLRPFNICLSPIVEQSLDINRDWSFSSPAVEFLLGHGFSIDALCKQGVRYLSRSEEQEAREHMNTRFNRLHTWDIHDIDQVSLDFLEEVRALLDNWVAGDQGQRRNEYLNIPPLTRSRKAQRRRTLPRYLSNQQRYLVHKVIRLEYPDLKSQTRHGYVQITETTAEMNRLALERKRDDAEKKIQKSIGFRWIAEALVGGDLTALEPSTFAPLMAQAENPKFTLDELSSGLKECLKENRVVFIGHNCFTDLVFFYHHFIGKLPQTLEEFKLLVHRVFPLVIDTKYLFTYDEDSSNARSSLADANREFAKVAFPRIIIDPVYSKYAWSESLHEAGYDSMLAAILFIRLSAQLHKEGKILNNTKGTLREMNIDIATGQPFNVQDLFNSVTNDSSKRAQSTSNDHVDLPGRGDDGKDSDVWSPEGSHQSLAEPANHVVANMVRNGLLIPRLDSGFWDVYGNKLRVFGTHEGVVDLGEIAGGII